MKHNYFYSVYYLIFYSIYVSGCKALICPVSFVQLRESRRLVYIVNMWNGLIIPSKIINENISKTLDYFLDKACHLTFPFLSEKAFLFVMVLNVLSHLQHQSYLVLLLTQLQLSLHVNYQTIYNILMINYRC